MVVEEEEEVDVDVKTAAKFNAVSFWRQERWFQTLSVFESGRVSRDGYLERALVGRPNDLFQ